MGHGCRQVGQSQCSIWFEDCRRSLTTGLVTVDRGRRSSCGTSVICLLNTRDTVETAQWIVRVVGEHVEWEWVDIWQDRGLSEWHFCCNFSRSVVWVTSAVAVRMCVIRVVGPSPTYIDRMARTNRTLLQDPEAGFETRYLHA